VCAAYLPLHFILLANALICPACPWIHTYILAVHGNSSIREKEQFAWTGQCQCQTLKWQKWGRRVYTASKTERTICGKSDGWLYKPPPHEAFPSVVIEYHSRIYDAYDDVYSERRAHSKNGKCSNIERSNTLTCCKKQEEWWWMMDVQISSLLYSAGLEPGGWPTLPPSLPPTPPELLLLLRYTSWANYSRTLQYPHQISNNIANPHT